MISRTNDFYCDFVLSQKISIEVEAESDEVLAFRHTKPSWTFHVVIIPKRHVAQLINLDDMTLAADIMQIAKQIILKYKLNESNYRIITNGGSFQDSKHLHFHLMSGEKI